MEGYGTGKGIDFWTLIKVAIAISILVGIISAAGSFVNSADHTIDDTTDYTGDSSGNELNAPPASDDNKTFIKTVKVPFGETGLEAVREASPGVFYEYTDYDDSQLIGHEGFVILEKNKIEGTKLLFNGSEVEIIKTGGHYKIKSLNNINPNWCVVYKLPFVSSSGKPIFENVKYVEFHFSTDDLKDGKYAYLILSKKE